MGKKEESYCRVVEMRECDGSKYRVSGKERAEAYGKSETKGLGDAIGGMQRKRGLQRLLKGGKRRNAQIPRDSYTESPNLKGFPSTITK